LADKMCGLKKLRVRKNEVKIYRNKKHPSVGEGGKNSEKGVEEKEKEG